MSSPCPHAVYSFSPCQCRGQLAGLFPLLSSLKRGGGEGPGWLPPARMPCDVRDVEARSSFSCSRIRPAALPSKLLSYNDQEEVGRGCARGPSMLKAQVLRTWLNPLGPRFCSQCDLDFSGKYSKGQGSSSKGLLKIHQEPRKGERRGVGSKLHSTGSVSVQERQGIESQNDNTVPAPQVKAPGLQVVPSAEVMDVHLPHPLTWAKRDQ